MKGDIKTRFGVYRRCPACGRKFPAFSISNINAAMPKFEPHSRKYCKPCQRQLGTEGGVKS